MQGAAFFLFRRLSMTWMDLIGCGAVIAPAAVCWLLTLMGAFDEPRS